MNDRFCVGAFEQTLEEFVGSPQMIGFLFARDRASLPLTVSKRFDMDCKTLGATEMFDSLGKLLSSVRPSCLVGVYTGIGTDQLGQARPVLSLSPIVTFSVDFDKEAVDEYLKVGSLKRDPPVIEGSTRDFVWVNDTSTWGWTKEKWQPSGVGIYLDKDDIQLSFFGDDKPSDAFETPKFSDMSPSF